MSGCYCEYGYGESPSFSSVREVKARKQHKCCECHEPIAVGETYQRLSGCWDGRFNAFKTCKHCAALRDEAWNDTDGEMPIGSLACWYTNKIMNDDENAQRRAGEAKHG